MEIHTKTQYNPYFGDLIRPVYIKTLKGRKLSHANNTKLCRETEVTKKLMWLMRFLYLGKSKINFYDYGCSAGFEPMTYLIHLYSNHPRLAKKIDKIIAKDFDPYIIEIAKKGVLFLTKKEIEKANTVSKGNITEFFKFINPARVHKRLYLQKPAQVKPKYRDKIQYELADIMQDCENRESKGSVVSVCNFWPYLGREKALELVEKLSSKLKSRCIIVTGEYDGTTKQEFGVDLKQEFTKRGFICVGGQIFVRI